MNIRRLLRFGFATLVALQARTAAAQDQSALTPAVSYVVSIPQPHTHVLVVEMSVTGNRSAELDVSMPVWTPGSYLVREYERHVIGFAASAGDGSALPWRKIDKNTWRISGAEAPTVSIRYEVYAREPGIRWSFVYDDGGHILGPNLFMHVVGLTDQPTAARFELPASWQLTGGIAPAPDDPFLISARSYHELIDTPMLIGDFDQTIFEVDGIPHLIAILGPHDADLDQMAEDFTKIVKVCSEMFGGLPYERYAFIFTTLTGGGGIEHANGTTIGMGGFGSSSDRAQQAVLGVTAHEFFHVWNVKRIQPPAFRPYDYEQENYTDALWFYEGFTSYYGSRILHRAGLTDSYEDPLSIVNTYRSDVGHTNQSAADASFNAWIHLYRSDESFPNYRVNYYFMGQVIANLLELEIAHRTGGERGLDDVMRLIWQRTMEGATYDSEEIRTASEEVAGGSLRELFDRYVYGTAEIPFEQFYALAGYDLVVDEEATQARDSRGYLGARIGESNGRASLGTIVKDSPAWQGGLSPGDEIVSLDGEEVPTAQSLIQMLGRHGPGETVELVVSRFGETRTLTITLGKHRAPVYKLVQTENPTHAQLAVRRVWQDWEPEQRMN